jgi:hypothetical protein
MPTRWLIPMVMACPLACAPVAAPPPSPTGSAAVNVTAPPPSPTGRAAANISGPVAKIDEITLERWGHAETAPCYQIKLSKDGTAIYAGRFNVARIGTFKAKIEPEDFRRLEELVNRFRYFEMKDEYETAIDANSVKISVSRGGQSKTIQDGWSSTAPLELWAIEMAIDALAAQVTDWKQTE